MAGVQAHQLEPTTPRAPANNAFRRVITYPPTVSNPGRLGSLIANDCHYYLWIIRERPFPKSILFNPFPQTATSR
jgi:hypothetical protein